MKSNGIGWLASVACRNLCERTDYRWKTVVSSFTYLQNSDGVTDYVGIEYRRLSGVVYKFHDFQPISGRVWETIQDRAIVTVERS